MSLFLAPSGDKDLALDPASLKVEPSKSSALDVAGNLKMALNEEAPPTPVLIPAEDQAALYPKA